MSWKSILLSILSIVLGVGLLFVVVLMFGVNILLGILGVILWGMINVTLRSKALDAASGVVDKVLAKYVVPVILVILVFGLLMFYIIPAALAGQLFEFSVGGI